MLTAPTGLNTGSELDLVMIHVDEIDESPDNPRRFFSEAFIAELAASLQAVGQLTPCLVRPHPTAEGRYELAAGATRWRAAKQAGISELLCVVREMDDATFLEALTFENLKRRDLQPMEEARAYALLQKRLEGWTVEKIAERSGVSASYVRDRMRLLTLVPDVATLLEAGQINLSHALELAKLRPHQQQEMVDADMWDGGLWREAEGRLIAGDGDEDEARREPVSARELRGTIADRFAVDLADVPALFPEMARAIEAAETQTLAVVRISTAYSAPKAAEGEPPVLPRRHWERADGTKGHRKCKHATQLGAVVHGHEWRGEAFLVCTASTTCRVHFVEDIAFAERQAKQKAAGAGKPKGEDPWEKRQRLEREAKARFQPALPAVRAAIATAIAAASTKVDGPLDKLVARGRAWPKAKDGIGRGTTPEDLMRHLAWREVDGNQWNAHEELPRIGKSLGVDVAKLVKAAQPAAKKKPSAKKAKGGKRA